MCGSFLANELYIIIYFVIIVVDVVVEYIYNIIHCWKFAL
jgi:hypothetical protein